MKSCRCCGRTYWMVVVSCSQPGAKLIFMRHICMYTLAGQHTHGVSALMLLYSFTRRLPSTHWAEYMVNEQDGTKDQIILHQTILPELYSHIYTITMLQLLMSIYHTLSRHCWSVSMGKHLPPSYLYSSPQSTEASLIILIHLLILSGLSNYDVMPAAIIQPCSHLLLMLLMLLCYLS